MRRNSIQTIEEIWLVHLTHACFHYHKTAPLWSSFMIISVFKIRRGWTHVVCYQPRHLPFLESVPLQPTATNTQLGKGRDYRCGTSREQMQFLCLIFLP